MAKRYTDTEEWQAPAFRRLPPDAKLLLRYLRDACDIAGFFEWDVDGIIFHTGLDESRIKAAREALASTLETNGKYVWMPDFVILQNNWPFNKKNGCHRGIIKLLEARMDFSPLVVRLLDGKGLPSPYEGANKGLFRPSSTSKGIGKALDSTASMNQRDKQGLPSSTKGAGPQRRDIYQSGKSQTKKSKAARAKLKEEVYPRLKELDTKEKLTKKQAEEKKALEDREAQLIDEIDAR